MQNERMGQAAPPKQMEDSFFISSIQNQRIMLETVNPQDDLKKRESGIMLIPKTENKMGFGKVLNFDPEIKMDIKKGDIVAFTVFDDLSIEWGGETYRLVYSNSVIAVLKPKVDTQEDLEKLL